MCGVYGTDYGDEYQHVLQDWPDLPADMNNPVLNLSRLQRVDREGRQAAWSLRLLHNTVYINSVYGV